MGLSRVSEYIVSEMLPGFTSLTNRGRNYSFYAWAIKQANSEKPTTVKQFESRLAQLEAAYVMAGILDAEGRPGVKGPIGDRKGRQRLSESFKNVNTEFSVLNNPAGGFGQYYRSSMSLLGLIAEARRYAILTERGKLLAEAYGQTIQGTEYLRKYLLESDIPIDVLREYGEKCSYLRMAEGKEGDLLFEVLLDKNQNNSPDPTSRRDTILYVLSMHEYLEEQGCALDDSIFRDLIYFGCTVVDDKLIVPPRPSFAQRVLREWRFFQFQEYFSLALEQILVVFIEATEAERGVTKEEFLDMATANPGKMSIFAYERASKNRASTSSMMSPKEIAIAIDSLTVNEVMERILSHVGVKSSLSKTTSLEFDSAVSIGHDLSEANIANLLVSTEHNDSGSVVHNSLLLLVILFLRYWQYKDEVDERTCWIRVEEEKETSIYSFLCEVEGRLDRMTIGDFMKFTLNKIIDLHGRIAFEKLNTGNDTFRFEERENGRYFSKRSYSYTERVDRFNSLENVLEDIGALTDDGTTMRLTEYGREVMGAHVRN